MPAATALVFSGKSALCIKVGRNRVRRQCVLSRFHCRRRLPCGRHEAYQARPAADGGACGDYSRTRFFSRIHGRMPEVALMHGRKKPLRKPHIRRFKQKSGRHFRPKSRRLYRLCRSGDLRKLRSFGVFPRCREIGRASCRERV